MFHIVFFLRFYKPPDLRKIIFTTWNVLKSELYLTYINFWKIHDDLRACLEVIRLKLLLVDSKMWNLVSKCNFLHFWPPEKWQWQVLNLVFLKVDLEVFAFPQNQYLHLSFQIFNDTLKMLQITFFPQIQQEKSLKWP